MESDAFPEKNYIAFEIVKEIPGKQEKIKISKKRRMILGYTFY